LYGFDLNNITANQFAELFLSATSMIDVRAPIEYSKGAFPHTVNLPILTDSERQKIGSCYKKQGQDAAIELGHKLVSGEIKQQRIKLWKNIISNNPEVILYCFRGGMRSKISQQWLKQSGSEIAFVEGGYKALRQFLLAVIEDYSSAEKLVIIGGRTGTGKTRVIHKLKSSLDLEGLANHRGSAFGKLPTPQPSQINFENNLAIALLKLKQKNLKHIAVEDESNLIGRNAIPSNFKNAMSLSKLVIVEQSLEERVAVVIEEYVSDLLKKYAEHYTELNFQEVFSVYQKTMLDSLQGIKKRIGGDRYKTLYQLMKKAMQSHLKNNDIRQHSNWIRPLLNEYYDKMYDYQLNITKRQVIFKGSREQVFLFLNNQ
jgi:tRNA 2-selenouridine synthase